MKESSKNLVIGATGYIGKNLFLKLNKINQTIGTSSKNNDNYINLNLREPSKFNYDLIGPGDNVFFTSAISSPDNMSEAREINVIGTSYFINKATSNGARVIFFSSDTVYGESENECNEESFCKPLGDYAIMKSEIENTFLSNPLFKTIRLSYVFSGHDKLSFYLIHSDQQKYVAELFHPFLRSFIYLNDVIEAVIELSSKWNNFPTSIINLGGPQLLSRLDFASILKKHVIPNLSYKETLPPENFFLQRPKVINMKSKYLSLLLSRDATSIEEAVKFEFNKELI
jgi:nucleoside-diphosphate-sugar epimerase